MKSNTVLLLLLVAALSSVTRTNRSQNELTNNALYFVVMLPFPDPDPASSSGQPSLTDGPDIYPAAELAVDHINNQSGLLEGHTLKVLQSNGGCDISTTTVLGFVKDIVHANKPHRRVAGVIGPGCSDSALNLAPLLAHNRSSSINIHIAGSPRLTRYPYTLGMLSSTRVYADAMVALMRRNEWRRIFVLYEESRPFFSASFSAFRDKIKNEFPRGEFGFKSSQLFSGTYLPLNDVEESRCRIIFVMASPGLTNMLMCYALHLGSMSYPTYQWVFLDRILSDFREVSFSFNQKDYTCSREELVDMTLNKAILLHYRLTHLRNTTTSFGRTYSQYFEEYKERANAQNVTTSIYGAPIYDAVWSLALALNNSINPLQDLGFSLSDYHLDHSQRNNMTEVILNQLYDHSFAGISGNITFDNETGFVDSRGIDIFQNIDGETITVAYYSNDNGLEIINEGVEFVRSDFDMRRTLVHPVAAALLILAEGILLAVILATHILTVAFRAHRSIRASSLRLTNIIYVGCYMLFGALAVYQIITVFASSELLFSISCNAFVWCWSISYTLMFGAICVRNWRVYRIFKHFTNPGKYLSDNALTVFVLFLLLLDVALCGGWSGSDPQVRKVSETFQYKESDVPFIQTEATCTSKHYFPWLASILAYKSALLLCVVLLAAMTGRVHHGLKDFSTRRFAVLSYISVLVAGIGLPLYYIISEVVTKVTVHYVILSILLGTQLCLFLGFVFIPVLYPAMQERLSNRIQRRRLNV